METPLLSICIATLNRDSYLDQTLASIISQATPAIEIVIIDGGSVDETATVVGKWRELFPHITYERQDQKSGLDFDYNLAVDRAHGRYCWLLSDDDPLKPDALCHIFPAIQQDYGLIIVNSEVRNADLSSLIDERRLTLRQNTVFDVGSDNQLFATTAHYLSFIGCVIISRELWQSRDREQYFGSMFIHVGVIFQQPLPCRTLVVTAPVLTLRYGNASWTGRAFEIWMFKWPAMVWSFPHVSDEAKRAVCHPEPWRRAQQLLFYRARGAYSEAEYQRLLAPRLASFRSRLLARTLARLPQAPLAWLGVLYFSLVFKGSRLPLEDMLGARRRPPPRGAAPLSPVAKQEV